MEKNNYFKKIRAELDNAITYGTKEDALAIAKLGFKLAQNKETVSELNYFKAQIEIIYENYTKAISHLDRTIEFNPLDGAAYNDRALCMVDLGIIDESFYYFDKGIEVDPDYATVHHNKGWLLNNIGRHTEAIDCFNKALELESNRAVTYDNLADALFNIGDYSGALNAYKKVLMLLGSDSCLSIQENIVKQMEFIRKKIIKKKKKS